MQKYKKGSIVRTTHYHLRKDRYVLIYRFNAKFMPMWAARIYGKLDTPENGCNLLESRLYFQSEVKKQQQKKVDLSKVNIKVLTVLIKNKNKTAVQEFVKRYKKLPKIK